MFARRYANLVLGKSGIFFVVNHRRVKNAIGTLSHLPKPENKGVCARINLGKRVQFFQAVGLWLAHLGISVCRISYFRSGKEPNTQSFPNRMCLEYGVL